MRVDRERKLHKFLRDYPYIIDPELERWKPGSEVTIGDKRLDLVFARNGQYTIVELKRTRLQVADIEQLSGYVGRLKDRGYELTGHHYLVGKRPKREEILRRVASRMDFTVVLRYLYHHIGTEFVWDIEERKYVPFQDEMAENQARYSGHYDFKF